MGHSHPGLLPPGTSLLEIKVSSPGRERSQLQAGAGLVVAEMILEARLTGPNWYLIKSNLRAAHFPGLPIFFSGRKSCWSRIPLGCLHEWPEMVKGRNTSPLQNPSEHVSALSWKGFGFIHPLVSWCQGLRQAGNTGEAGSPFDGSCWPL